MPTAIKPYLFRASLFAGFALMLGILLSLVIYISSDLVRDNSIDLVTNRMPVLRSINKVIADISEQERIIYKYYANQNQSLFNSSIKHIQNNIFTHSQELAKHPSFSAALNHIRAQQTQMAILIKKFDQTMKLPINKWDKLRHLLEQMSLVRQDMLPILYQIKQPTELAVKQGHKTVLEQMNFNHNMVIIYAVSLVLLSLLIAWYVKQYALTNAQNTRLALFPQLNPNAILSVTNLGNLVFNNPACYALLSSIGLAKEDIQQLVPNNFDSVRQQMSHNSKHSLRLEQSINDHVLQLTINWLVELDVYDIHILDITEQKLAEQKINNLAYYMQSTQLPNQFKLNADIDELVAEQNTFSLGLFEIRNFNRLVTSHGVEAIAELTKVLAGIIAHNLPTKSYLYHLNQNQFALLSLDVISASLLQKLVVDIGINAEKPVLTHFGEFFIDLDFGFSLFPHHGESFSQLYKNAHTALNLAAADEYINSIIFKAEFSQVLKTSVTMLNNLHNALANKELFLVFQPQLDIINSRITGIETLVRWRHQESIISPVDFIPLAEQSGLIVPIGQWILEQGCCFAKRLVDKGYQDIVVAINVSPRQFSHPDFVCCVKKALKKSQLLAKNLELEITESVFMHNEQEMLSVLKQLKALGLQLSIDDFGTGYSSLSYLKTFPVDKLKIDQSFIRNCHENEEDRALVKTIVALGKNLGMSLIAEGVEEYQHLTFLQGLDCDEIQGYWFSKPLLPNDLIEFLQNNNEVDITKYKVSG